MATTLWIVGGVALVLLVVWRLRVAARKVDAILREERDRVEAPDEPTRADRPSKIT